MGKNTTRIKITNGSWEKLKKYKEEEDIPICKSAEELAKMASGGNGFLMCHMYAIMSDCDRGIEPIQYDRMIHGKMPKSIRRTVIRLAGRLGVSWCRMYGILIEAGVMQKENEKLKREIENEDRDIQDN